jgi:hypothetical protein
MVLILNKVVEELTTSSSFLQRLLDVVDLAQQPRVHCSALPPPLQPRRPCCVSVFVTHPASSLLGLARCFICAAVLLSAYALRRPVVSNHIKLSVSDSPLSCENEGRLLVSTMSLRGSLANKATPDTRTRLFLLEYSARVFEG